VVKGKKRQNNSKSYASNNLPFVNIYFCWSWGILQEGKEV
jgi:hypothetical protein